MILEQYFPVFFFILVSIVLGFILLLLGYLLGKRSPYQEKTSPYECGFESFGDARMQFDIRYYLVAILFILFDLEIAFLFPWAMAQDSLGISSFFAVLVFLAILVIGFVYEWKKGAIEWE
ncbi:NADH dehydrogenase I subunit A [Candidatus Kinetoplastibacterium desouzaii TCC079E]|uniref:NADH-quinone oxidoreductase subunit A n=1 Tax=Candidatus Kinetoplastidibacterium desouzai TCC079E TaxID=1208919 RepID=M1LMV2_9PROT|nr:NADH-quinone oxidoreductase subunit A [Candidatus Kinetoplastibacterium desouzaii]AGF47052.1 NADH dehydrogenase I subunit A [Candidatus Kinetoplastibacterium desouzaii TCC079E]